MAESEERHNAILPPQQTKIISHMPQYDRIFSQALQTIRDTGGSIHVEPSMEYAVTSEPQICPHVEMALLARFVQAKLMLSAEA